jgi:hypothetical protein
LVAFPAAGPWKVYARWIKDSVKFNEWMNPIDYEVDDVPLDKPPVPGERQNHFPSRRPPIQMPEVFTFRTGQVHMHTGSGSPT